MSTRKRRIAIVGTFDIENYGDLVFPLVAKAELDERFGHVDLHPFSYHPKSPPDWPYAVDSVMRLPELVQNLDGLLVGGGFLIRFDKDVAPGYAPPSTAIHHPTGNWLSPALVAQQHGVPVAFNAPGMHRNDIPAWSEPLLRQVLDGSGYVSVRDEPSRAALAPYAAGDITVVPDTGFGIGRLLDAYPADEVDELRAEIGLAGPYIVVQAADSERSFASWFARHIEQLQDIEVLVLAISPVLGERARTLTQPLPGAKSLSSWPHPLLLAALVDHAEAVVGHSYHLAVTGLCRGVPVFTPADLSIGKYSALAGFDALHAAPHDDVDPGWFRDRLGKRHVPAAAHSAADLLAAHWDRIADVVRDGPAATQPACNRLWQALPGWLENGSAGVRPGPGEVLNLRPLRSHRLETDPYRWAMIDGLYAPDVAADLTDTYPHDRFKRIASHGGEKDYDYHARSLIGMGATSASDPAELSDAWRKLADDLLSPQYRSAMSLLIGRDLSDALLEVNVFHYGPGSELGAHADLPDKIVTHVLYFNETWNASDGGSLSILRSRDPADVVADIQPLVGNSAVIVRSDDSWHAVAPVVADSRLSRRSITVTFYNPGSVSSMWPPGDPAPLQDYHGAVA